MSSQKNSIVHHVATFFTCVCSNSTNSDLSEEELLLSSSKLLDWMVNPTEHFNKDGVIDEKDVIALMNDTFYHIMIQ